MDNVRELNLEELEKVSGGVEYPVHRESLIICSKCGQLHLIDEPCRRLEDLMRQKELEESGQIIVPRDGSPGPNIKPDIPLPDIPIPDIPMPDIPIPGIKIPLP